MISQKATILCLFEILKKYSDENHVLTTDDIRKKLKQIYDVDMERRAVYRNVDALRTLGIEIAGYKDNHEGYFLIDRTFEPSEVRLLCDAVAASDMITDDTSKTIIQELISTQSVFQGRMLQKTIYVKPASKNFNKQLFYNIDTLNIAINQGCMVSAIPLSYNYNLELSPITDTPLCFSPYATLWAQGNYYVLGKDEHNDTLTHYRVDFMKDLQILERGIDMIFGGFNPSQYARKYIIDAGEATQRFVIDCPPDLWSDIMEYFGSSLTVLTQTDSMISIRVHCIPSKMKQWVMTHLNQCEVISPKSFREEIQQIVFDAYQKYW